MDNSKKQAKGSGKQILLHLLYKYSTKLGGVKELEKATEMLRTAFLLHGSTTDEMWENVNMIEWGSEKSEETGEELRQGVRLKNKNLSLADFFYEVIWEEEIPKRVKQKYPNITQKEYDSMMHLITLLLTSLQWNRIDNTLENNGEIEEDGINQYFKSYQKKLELYRENPKEFLGHK